MWCCIEHFYFSTDTSSLDSFIRLEYFLSFNMFEQTNSSNFFSSHPHEYDEVKHFLTVRSKKKKKKKKKKRRKEKGISVTPQILLEYQLRRKFH